MQPRKLNAATLRRAGVIAMRAALLPVCVASFLALHGAPAHAQGGPPPEPGKWSVRIGAGGILAPIYPGSRSLGFTPIPLVDLAYRPGLPGLDTVFLNARDGLGIVAVRFGAISVGGGVGYARGRDQDVAARLNGMGDISSAAAGNLFVRADFGPVGFSARAEKAFGGQSGTTAAVGASYRIPVTADFSLAARVDGTWADQSHMQEWFGISGLKAQRTSFQAYRPESGMRDVTFMLSATYAITQQWRINGSAGVVHLLGDAAKSPITQRRTQPIAMFGATYQF